MTRKLTRQSIRKIKNPKHQLVQVLVLEAVLPPSYNYSKLNTVQVQVQLTMQNLTTLSIANGCSTTSVEKLKRVTLTEFSES